MYNLITLLYTWCIVNQLYFNKKKERRKKTLLTDTHLSLRHHLEPSLLEDPWKSMESADLG